MTVFHTKSISQILRQNYLLDRPIVVVSFYILLLHFPTMPLHWLSRTWWNAPLCNKTRVSQTSPSCCLVFTCDVHFCELLLAGCFQRYQYQVTNKVYTCDTLESSFRIHLWFIHCYFFLSESIKQCATVNENYALKHLGPKDIQWICSD